MLRGVAICVLWALTVLPLSAQDPKTTPRIIAAFEGWMQANGAQNGTIAVRYQGKLVAQHGIGVAADTPMEMASLSKAITGVCVAELVREGALTYDTRFDTLIGRGLDVTVAQLLTQTSGLKRDSTQNSMPAWLGDRTDRAADVLDHVIARGGPNKKAGRFRYNNEDYALLSLVIEAASGDTYQETCQRLVLRPAGADAQRSPKTGAYLAWGGWRMTSQAYGAFLTHWFGANFDPFWGPTAALEGGVHYGTGMFLREFRGSHNYWHHGGLCFPGVLNSGSFAASWMGGWSVVVAYDACPYDDMVVSLDQVLVGAVFK